MDTVCKTGKVEKRISIVDAAVEEFQELGFAGASMDRIACRACVSKRTVYNHFESKEALFRAIVDQMAETASRELVVRYEQGAPIREQLVALGWSEGRILIDPCQIKLARVAVGEAIRDPVLATALAEKLEVGTIFEAFFAAAAADRALDCPDPASASSQFLGLIKSRGFWPVVFTGEPITTEEMDRVVRDAVELILARYGA